MIELTMLEKMILVGSSAKAPSLEETSKRSQELEGRCMTRTKLKIKVRDLLILIYKRKILIKIKIDNYLVFRSYQSSTLTTPPTDEAL